MRAASSQVGGKAILLDEELDAAPPPVRKRMEEIRHVGEPRIRASGKVRAPHRRIDERADGVEVVPVAGIQVVRVPLAHLPRLHLLIIDRTPAHYRSHARDVRPR
jgi:hypothetical protein